MFNKFVRSASFKQVGRRVENFEVSKLYCCICCITERESTQIVQYNTIQTERPNEVGPTIYIAP